MSRQQAEEKLGFMLRVASGWIFPVRPLCGSMSSEPCISGIDMCLGRGIIISIVAVLFAIPQILLLGDRIIEKTVLMSV